MEAEVVSVRIQNGFLQAELNVKAKTLVVNSGGTETKLPMLDS